MTTSLAACPSARDAERVTPPLAARLRLDRRCFTRDGRAKRWYATCDAATAACSRHQRVYPCPGGSGYHVGASPIAHTHRPGDYAMIETTEIETRACPRCGAHTAARAFVRPGPCAACVADDVARKAAAK